jgi:diadenosine tetraphosphate (Ap4A) HIT family hydrolase
MEKNLFPNETILVTKFFDVHQDWFIPIPAFFIIASRDNNKRSIEKFTEEEAKELGEVIRHVRIGMSKVLDVENVYLFQNEDSEYGFHIWIFPRYSWMDKFGRKIESVRPIMNYAKKYMATNENIEMTKEATAKMRNYLKGAL